MPYPKLLVIATTLSQLSLSGAASATSTMPFGELANPMSFSMDKPVELSKLRFGDSVGLLDTAMILPNGFPAVVTYLIRIERSGAVAYQSGDLTSNPPAEEVSRLRPDQDPKPTSWQPTSAKAVRARVPVALAHKVFADVVAAAPLGNLGRRCYAGAYTGGPIRSRPGEPAELIVFWQGEYSRSLGCDKRGLGITADVQTLERLLKLAYHPRSVPNP